MNRGELLRLRASEFNGRWVEATSVWSSSEVEKTTLAEQPPLLEEDEVMLPPPKPTGLCRRGHDRDVYSVIFKSSRHSCGWAWRCSECKRISEAKADKKKKKFGGIRDDLGRWLPTKPQLSASLPEGG